MKFYANASNQTLKRLLLLVAVCFAGTTFAQQAWENFDDERNVNYGFIHGVLNQGAANPDNTGINTSATCGSYIRNASEQFDVLVIEPPAVMDDLTDYVNGTKQITLQVYSPAPGITVQITLEDEDTALPGNFPTGRHSVYLATTTVANQWETLTFTFDVQPDPSVPDDEVELFILLFNPDSFTGDTYYWDELNGPEFPDPCAGVATDPNVFEDYECQRNMSYDFIDGWVTVGDNPDMSGANTSATAAKYVRNAFFENAAFGGAFNEGMVDLTTDNQVVVDIWDFNSPTNIIVSFQDDNNNPVIERTFTTTSSSEWVTYTMDLSSVLSPANSNITKWVMLVNAGNFASDSLWMDNFGLDGYIAVGMDEQAGNTKQVSVFPNPFANNVQVSYELSTAERVTLQITDLTGRVIEQDQAVRSAGVQRWMWEPTANVADGTYLVTVRGESFVTTQKLLLHR